MISMKSKFDLSNERWNYLIFCGMERVCNKCSGTFPKKTLPLMDTMVDEARFLVYWEFWEEASLLISVFLGIFLHLIRGFS